MAKLYFKYASMGAGKSLDLIKVAYNYKENNKNTIIFKSIRNNENAITTISSRVGMSIDAIGLYNTDNIFKIIKEKLNASSIDCVLVDEVQFLNKEQILQLSDIVDTLNIPVICYGLRSDFKLDIFEGSAQLMAIADELEEMKTICWCGKKAKVNARVINNNIVTDGDKIVIGGNELYVSLCRKHYKQNKIKKNTK